MKARNRWNVLRLVGMVASFLVAVSGARAKVEATGGDYTYDKMIDGSRYRIHIYTNVGPSTLTVTQGGEVEYLVVGGGGAGGGFGGPNGGGGGGGVLSNVGGKKFLLTPQTYAVQVGTGGVGVADQGGIGIQSVFGEIIALGGGGGGTGRNAGRFKALGGSSGGGGYGGTHNNYYFGTGGKGTPGQGYDGGDGNWTNALNSGGGGGGAGAPGLAGIPDIAGDGGQGVSNTITGEVMWFGGGGGGSCGGGTAGAGGLGGGAPGRTTAGLGAHATPNTGGGGGAGCGAADSLPGGHGGSGIVIIRYLIPYSYTEATGGDVVYNQTIDDTRYRIHVYTNVGESTFTVTQPGPVEYLVVAGGGAGGGGGGGAGGVLQNVGGEPFLVAPATYPVSVGGGGTGIGLQRGRPGANSLFASMTALGGGGGGGAAAVQQFAGGDGGSGGGGVGASYQGTWFGTGGKGTSGQGHAGGDGNWSVEPKSGGGGGGAGAAGTVGTTAANGQAFPDILLDNRTSNGRPMGGIRFDNLTVMQPVARPWLSCSNNAINSGTVAEITGTVTVVQGGTQQVITLTPEWLEETFPSRNLSPASAGMTEKNISPDDSNAIPAETGTLLAAGSQAVEPAGVAKILAGELTEVYASSYGFNAADSTSALRAAITSGASRVIVDYMGAPWITDKLTCVSDQEIVFEAGVEVLAKQGLFRGGTDALFSLISVTNVTLRGPGATLRMRRTDYTLPPYSKAEWRHVLNIKSSVNINVFGLTLTESGGDGIYLGCVDPASPNRDIHIKDVVCDKNYRQGISVISAENLLIENTVMRNTAGTAPAAGIDFEPNHSAEQLKNCVIRNCVSENNQGAGYLFYLNNLTRTSEPVSIQITNCLSSGDRQSVRVVTQNADASAVRGTLTFTDCRFENALRNSVLVQDMPAFSLALAFDDCVIADGAVDMVGGIGGNGGDGIMSTIAGTENWFGGGGGGSGYEGTAGSGGLGGGAPGRNSMGIGAHATPNTGGGGGAALGGSADYPGGSGGSGIVVIRYAIQPNRSILIVR